MFQDKIILVTGGTGSLGTAITKKLLKTDVSTIRIFSRGEWKQVEMASKFSDNRLRFFIGDVRDKEFETRRQEDIIREEERDIKFEEREKRQEERDIKFEERREEDEQKEIEEEEKFRKIDEDRDIRKAEEELEGQEKTLFFEAIRKRNAGIPLTDEEKQLLIDRGVDPNPLPEGRSNLGFGLL